MRVIVCGSQDYNDKAGCFQELDEILSGISDVEIISGNAKGADQFGEEFARSHGLALRVFPADWKKYGKAAGPIRNREMLKYALETDCMVIAFWNRKSRGTGNMLKQAKAAGVKCHIVLLDE